MTQNRIRIVDVADALGLSTATVSKVIHGKTEKISDKTVKRVQQELESSGYIPNMAGILLARNNSRIIGVVVNDHEKYEGRVLEDGFVMSSLNALSHEVNEKGYFLMIKTTSDIREIPVFASMWNMDGLILIGFCEADYESLRNQMRISFVVYDGYFEKCSKVVNLVIDHYDGGYQAMQELLLQKADITAVFAMADVMAIGAIRALRDVGLRVPEDISVLGFDGLQIGSYFLPKLTTVHQSVELLADRAAKFLVENIEKGVRSRHENVPFTMDLRESVIPAI